MRTISYLPSEDTLKLKLGPRKKKPTKEIGPFRLWWDYQGVINGLEIRFYVEKLRKEFRKDLRTVRLGGIWKGIKIKDSDIRAARKELLTLLEEKW
jgi:hypothetical protein